MRENNNQDHQIINTVNITINPANLENIIRYINAEEETLVDFRDSLPENWQELIRTNNARTIPILLYALEYGNIDILNNLINNGANIDAQDENGYTALHHVIGQNNNIDIINNLIDRGANLDVQTRLGNTALHLAIQENDITAINKLIEMAANAEIQDLSGFNSLHIASLYNNIDAIKILIDNGTNVNLTDINGSTALHIVAQNGNIDALNLLLDSGTTINAQDNFGNSALLLAEQNNHIDAVNRLIERGADINLQDIHGNTALHSAATHGHIDVTTSLIIATLRQREHLTEDENRFLTIIDGSEDVAQFNRDMQTHRQNNITIIQNMLPANIRNNVYFIVQILKNIHNRAFASKNLQENILTNFGRSINNDNEKPNIGKFGTPLPPEVSLHMRAYLDKKDFKNLAKVNKKTYGFLDKEKVDETTATTTTTTTTPTLVTSNQTDILTLENRAGDSRAEDGFVARIEAERRDIESEERLKDLSNPTAPR